MRVPALLFLGLTISTLSATPVSFADHNFSIELPPGWTQMPPPVAQILLMAASADHNRKLVVAAMELPENERTTAAGDMRAGAKRSMGDQGWQFDPEESVTIAGQPFITLKGHQSSSGASSILYTTAAGNQAYMLTFVAGPGASLDDSETSSTIGSFHLLTPAAALPLTAVTEPSTASRLGYACGRLVGMAAIPILILLVWLIYRNLTKSRRENRRRRW